MQSAFSREQCAREREIEAAGLAGLEAVLCEAVEEEEEEEVPEGKTDSGACV